ncbi:4-alpha-glucanotransferase [Waterburya agarophytonicola K14]|uniref:4-alpha-glucanotransferase n=1 Tax=Waterburya agarophytonicola KI4 TaxID=2874699 RepID=A0A964FGN6_9CYAN|nr:4-alpha-glucanotransferase [Waterburya agarophytonicola]MCC0176804.1 4-alpha-glucanotransferase [Waterburya agarophytonicola KI4]
MLDFRASGILLHPTSLPSRFGIGDLGDQAYKFIDFLANSDQQIWQILPIGPTGFGNSPYLSYSALAGNPLLISPEVLHGKDLLTTEELNSTPDFPLDRVDFDRVIASKIPLLRRASDRFKTQIAKTADSEFKRFCDRQNDWLSDYALFMSLKQAHNGKSWHQWDADIAYRQPEAMAKWATELADEIFFHKFIQYQFFCQWKNLKQYANQKGIKIFGDIPIYVAHDSVDVWAHKDIFCLDEETGEASLMAGVPPDYFSATGQLWGNPVYNWEELEKTDFKWWIRRVEGILEYVDIIRIDHFRGFQAYWAVPQGEKTAMNGTWLDAPGDEFFQLLEKQLGKLPIVAEDLGVITPEVEALRDKFSFPGMKILQFAFDDDRANGFLPFNYTDRNCLVYTGTHDNNTSVGWFYERSPEAQARVVDYLGCLCDDGIHWALIRLALGSVGNTVVLPFQDILGLGTDAKMNTPSQPTGNWTWRCREEAFNDELSTRLKYLTHLYGRTPISHE